MLLPTYDVFDESRYFQPGDKHYVYGLSHEQLGITICEDVWNDKTFWADPLYPRDPVTELIAQGTSILINHLRFALHHRQALLCATKCFAPSRCSISVPIIYVNQVGGNDSLIFDGASVALTPSGEIAAQAKAFEEDLVFLRHRHRARRPPRAARDEIAYAHRCPGPGHPRLRPEMPLLQDHCRPQRRRRFRRGGLHRRRSLGKENVLGVSMPGPYSSEGSKTDARTLAQNLGIEFKTIPITEVFHSYEAALQPSFGNRPADATEENIQARIRGNYLMALSNKFGSMVLSTGNKSENAVGYCTLYGDMAGGLAVISDVPKTMVYRLARYINRERELIPRSTIEKAPSAELRPNQKDTDSLPEYDVLDRILKAYIEDVQSPEDIAAEFGFDEKLVRDIALRVDRNEYKRKQAAPGLKITSRAFGFGRWYPIAQRFIP